MSDSKFSSFSRDIVHGYEKVLASIFIKLFIDLYSSLKKNFVIHIDYADLDQDLLYEAESMDLIDAAKLYRKNIFSHKILDKYSKGRSFSIENAKAAITNTRFQVRTEKQTLINSLNMKKPYSFNVLAMEEVGRIAREITQIRHMLSHNNNMTQSTQALILVGNLARLMSITPDEIRSSTPRFQELNEFIKNNLFNSIIEVYKPEIMLSDESSDDVEDEIKLNEKIESILGKLDTLNEIKVEIANNKNSIESAHKSINELSQKYIDESSEVSRTIKEAVDPSRIRSLLQNQDIDSIDPISTEEIKEMKERLSALEFQEHDDVNEKLDNEYSLISEETTENLDLEEDANVIKKDKSQTKIPKHKKAKLSVGELEFVYQDYMDALNDGVDKKLVFLWAIRDMENDVSLTEDELQFVKEAVDSGVLDEEIYIEYIKENEVEEKLLTLDELKDSLLSLRLEIIDHMKPQFPQFQNWHNILMNVLVNEIIDERITKETDFRNTVHFEHYYNSHQISSSMESRWTKEELEKIKMDAKKLIDYQLEEFWPKISNLVSKLNE